MADKQLNKVNGQITDSITQVNTKVLADAPAMALGNFYTALGLSLSNAGKSATSAEQNANIMALAATVLGVNALGAIGSAGLGRTTEESIEKG